MAMRILNQRLAFLLTVASLTLFVAPALLAQTDEEIALQHIPAVVANDLATTDLDDAEVHVSVVRADFDHTGNDDYLVAAYAGVESGALRVFKTTPSLAIVADAPQTMGGEEVALTLRDVEGDGTPEMAVVFREIGGHSVTWVFKWAAGQLSAMTGTGIRECTLLDVDGDGVLEAVGGGIQGALEDEDEAPSVARYAVYEPVDGVFTRGEDLFSFTLATSRRSPIELRFTVPDPSASYVLRVANGDQAGAHRVTSGEISLNGTIVVNTGDLAGTGRVTTVNPQLLKTNELAIHVDGPADGLMFVTVAFGEPYTPPEVQPLPPCVWEEGDGLFTASFGYDNPGGEDVLIAEGPQNGFSPEPVDRGQPVSFAPGTHADEFWVQSNGETLTWTLAGTGVAASLDSPRCDGDPPVPRQNAANCTPGEPASFDANEVVWIEDSSPAGAGPLPWTEAESTSGTRSIHLAYAAGEHTVSSTGATQPVAVRIQDRLVFAMMTSACHPPREVQVRWHDAAGGWHGAWWGEPVLQGEGSLFAGGALRAAGDWVRFEIPATAIASADFAIDGLEIRLSDGEAWLDRFAILPAPPSIASLTMPGTVGGGNSVDAHLTLSSPAPGDGAIVNLSSDSQYVLPTNVFLPSGATSADFKIFTIMPNVPTTVTVTASCNGTVTATLNVGGQPLQDFVIDPDTVSAGETTQGTVRIEHPAMADLDVTLTNGNSQLVTVPQSVVIEQGQRQQSFTIQAAANVSTATPVTITASANGVSKSDVVTVTPCEMLSEAQPYIPETDRVWISDELPAGASFQNNGSATSIHWDSSQSADGTQAMGTAFIGSTTHYSFFINGLDERVEIGENLVFYVLLDKCRPPSEIFIRWYNTASGYTVTYWGTPTLGGEGGGVDMGPMPAPADGWARMEIPASLLRMEQGTITRLDIQYAGGQMWFDHFALSGSACIASTSEQPQIPAGDTVWIDDTLPSGASLQNNSGTSIHWDSSQSASGAQSLTSGYYGNSVNYNFFINGLSQPVAIGENVVFYVRLNECAPPEELMIRWYNSASGYALTYWGTPGRLGGEGGGIDMGPLPPADGQWARIEIPASLLGMEQSTVTRLDINYAGGQMWFDRFGKSGTACIPALATQPEAPAGDTVWIDDTLPSGASLQNNSGTSIHWDSSQSAGGSQSLASGYHGNRNYNFFINGLSEPMAIGENVVFYVLLNECAPPEELMIRWYNTASGYTLTYWGTPGRLGGEGGGIDMGSLPAANGQWTRIEIPASLLGMEQSTVTRLDINYAGGQMWFDRFGKSGTACIPVLATQPEAPAGDTVWIDDTLPSGASLQNNSGTSIHWDSSQSASGSQSLASGYHGNRNYNFFINGLSEPMAIGENVVFYVLLNECAPPEELMIRWYNTASGYTLTYWGTPGRLGEGGGINMGPLPAANGQWTRIEIPASLLGMEQSTVTRLDINYAGGQMWFDRFGKSGTACIPNLASQPQVPAGDTVWIDDTLPSGASLQNNSGTSIHWDSSQSASGSQSLASGYHGNRNYNFFVNSLSQPVATGKDVVFYVLLNECAPPEELMIRWYNTVTGYTVTYWGTPGRLGGESGGVNMGAMPAAGEWVRIAIPASLMGIEQSTVTRLDINYAGGQMWFDHFGTATP
jgi:hypothetical protein